MQREDFLHIQEDIEMSRFDEEPDGDPHGECAAEIHRLKAELATLRAAATQALEEAQHVYKITGWRIEKSPGFTALQSALEKKNGL
jgi:hypothetical protein